MHHVIFPKYPDYEIIIKSECYNYYKRWIYKPIDNHRRKEIAIINKKKQYHKQINIIAHTFTKDDIPSIEEYR